MYDCTSPKKSVLAATATYRLKVFHIIQIKSLLIKMTWCLCGIETCMNCVLAGILFVTIVLVLFSKSVSDIVPNYQTANIKIEFIYNCPQIRKGWLLKQQ